MTMDRGIHTALKDQDLTGGINESIIQTLRTFAVEYNSCTVPTYFVSALQYLRGSGLALVRRRRHRHNHDVSLKMMLLAPCSTVIQRYSSRNATLSVWSSHDSSLQHFDWLVH